MTRALWHEFRPTLQYCAVSLLAFLACWALETVPSPLQDILQAGVLVLWAIYAVLPALQDMVRRLRKALERIGADWGD